MRDIIQFIKTLNLAKLINYFVLKITFNISVLIKRNIQYGYPSSLSIEPTSNCNLACPECPTGIGALTRRKGNISWNLFTKIINEAKKHLLTCTLYFQGEPLLNPKIYEMIDHLRENNIYSIISTHGQFLTPENCEKLVTSGLNRIIISLDGLSQQSYSLYRRGGDVQKVIAGIKNLVAAKKKLKKSNPVIIVQFLVFKHNQHEIKELKQLKKEMGFNKIWIKSPQIYDFEQNNYLLSDIPKYNRYKIDNKGNYRLNAKLQNRCWRSWHNPVITVDGELIPCCFDKDANHSYGNVSNDSLQNIWNNNASKKFKNLILNKRDTISICHNCTEGIKHLKYK